MALSNAPAAKRALYDALKAATYADPQPGVWYGTPNVDHDYHDNIIVAPADRSLTVTQAWATIGANAQREEAIAIPVRVDVFREGTDEFEAEARAWSLASAVAAVLASRPFDPAVYEAHPDDFDQTVEVFADGRLTHLNLVVRCTSRVSGI